MHHENDILKLQSGSDREGSTSKKTLVERHNIFDHCRYYYWHLLHLWYHSFSREVMTVCPFPLNESKFTIDNIDKTTAHSTIRALGQLISERAIQIILSKFERFLFLI